MGAKPCLNCTQVAKVLAVSPMRVRRWALDGQIGYNLSSENTLEFNANDVGRLNQHVKSGDDSLVDNVCRVLAVTDTKNARVSLKSALGVLCYQFDFRSAGDHQETQNILKAYSPDIVFVDLRDGEEMLEVCRGIRANSDTAPIICVAMLGMKIDKDSIEGLEDFSHYILEKPANDHEYESIFQLEDSLFGFLDSEEDDVDSDDERSSNKTKKPSAPKKKKMADSKPESSSMVKSKPKNKATVITRSEPKPAPKDRITDKPVTEAPAAKVSTAKVSTAKASVNKSPINKASVNKAPGKSKLPESGKKSAVTKGSASQKIVSTMDDLYIPPPPTLFNQIQEAVPDLRKIAKLIEKDAGLTSKLLQVVNSAAFCLEVKIASVPHASMMLGLDFVLNIVTAVLLRDISDKAKSPELEMFWQVSTETAHYATYLSKKLCIGLPDEAFTLGLFHNCGIPIVLQKYPEYFHIVEKAYADSSAQMNKIERENINCTHAEVGFLISEAWSLPNYISEAIHYHHDLEYIQNVLDKATYDKDPYVQQVADYLFLLKMAEYFSELHLNIGKSTEHYEWDIVKPWLLLYVDMDEDDFVDLEDEIDHNFEVIDEM